MPISPEDFRERILARVRTHYDANRSPLLLAHLGLEIEKNDEWPVDRDGRNLRKLIVDTCDPDLQIVRDPRSPAYIAVVTPAVRADVEAQITKRPGHDAVVPVRLEDIAKPVLLAFCVSAPNQPVYVTRTKSFRYEVGNMPPERVGDHILVDPEYRRPGLRIDHPHLLSQSDKKDLESRIQRWATVHGVQVEQFSRLEPAEAEPTDGGKSALDRLLAAQSPDVAQRLMIPADIAQILSRIR